MKKAIDLIINGGKQAVKVITEVDIQLLVFFLESLDESETANLDQLKDLKASQIERLDYLKDMRESTDIEISSDFENDLIDYLGRNGKDFQD